MLEVDPGVPEKFGTLTVAMASLSLSICHKKAEVNSYLGFHKEAKWYLIKDSSCGGPGYAGCILGTILTVAGIGILITEVLMYFLSSQLPPLPQPFSLLNLI